MEKVTFRHDTETVEEGIGVKTEDIAKVVREAAQLEGATIGQGIEYIFNNETLPLNGRVMGVFAFGRYIEERNGGGALLRLLEGMK